MKWLRNLALLVLLANSLAAVGQVANAACSKETDQQTLSVSGNTLTFPDACGTQTQTFELVITGAPATFTATLVGLGRGGTTVTLASTSATTANQFLYGSGGPFDKYQITASWTGGTAPTVTANRTAATARHVGLNSVMYGNGWQLASFSQSPGKLFLSGCPTDFGVAIGAALQVAAGFTVFTPTIDATTIGCSPVPSHTDPWAGYVSQNGGVISQGGYTVQSDVPILFPPRWRWEGVQQGGPNQNGSSLQASAAFHTNYPAILGGSGSATVCIVQGSTTVIMGTNVAGTCTAGGAGTFTPTSPPATTAGYSLYICPNTATCGPINSVFVGTIGTVQSASQATLDKNVQGPIIIPAVGTGYQYALIQAFSRDSVRNIPGCTGVPGSCIDSAIQVERMTIDANDNGASDLHVAHGRYYSQEQSWIKGPSFIKGYNWIGLDIEGTNTQNSGPFDDIVTGGVAGQTVVTAIGLKFWQVGVHRGFHRWTFSNPSKTTTNTQIVNTSTFGSVTFAEQHHQSATDGFECGETTVWPWAPTGSGCQSVVFINNNGNPVANDVNNLYHFMRATSACCLNFNNVVIAGSSATGVNACILDDTPSQNQVGVVSQSSLTLQRCPEIYTSPNQNALTYLSGYLTGVINAAAGTYYLGGLGGSVYSGATASTVGTWAPSSPQGGHVYRLIATASAAGKDATDAVFHVFQNGAAMSPDVACTMGNSAGKVCYATIFAPSTVNTQLGIGDRLSCAVTVEVTSTLADPTCTIQIGY